MAYDAIDQVEDSGAGISDQLAERFSTPLLVLAGSGPYPAIAGRP